MITTRYTTLRELEGLEIFGHRLEDNDTTLALDLAVRGATFRLSLDYQRPVTDAWFLGVHMPLLSYPCVVQASSLAKTPPTIELPDGEIELPPLGDTPGFYRSGSPAGGTALARLIIGTSTGQLLAVIACTRPANAGQPYLICSVQARG